MKDVWLFVVHGGMLVIKLHFVIAEDDAICGDSINEGNSVREEGVTLNEDVFVVTYLLIFRLLDHGVNRDDTLCELVTLDEVVVKQIVDNLNIQILEFLDSILVQFSNECC